MANLTGVSRFKKTSLIKTKRGIDTYGIMSGYDRIKNIQEDEFDFFNVTSGFEGRCDLIAAQNYGDPHLEWVIVISNRIKNPFNWPKAGDVIILPRSDFVRGVL